MYNTATILIFTTLLVILSAIYISNIRQVTYNIEHIKNELKAEELDTEAIESIRNYLNNVESPKSQILKKAKVSFYDLSSKIDINFVDSTIFKKNKFKKLLKEDIFFNDFETFRNKVGFTTNLELYKNLFNPSINLDSYFTTFSLPNINCMSDIMLKKYLLLYTKNLSEIEQIVTWVQLKREQREEITQNEIDFKILTSGIKLSEIVTTIPCWNIKTFSTEISDISKSISEYSEKFYLGDKTTFWLVKIQSENKTTSVIYKLNLSEQKYEPISLTKEHNDTY